jgi:hypothetical protein
MTEAMTGESRKVIKLQRYPAQGESSGVAAGMRSRLCAGRYEIITGGPNPEFGFIGSDPYETNAGTGLVVPQTPSAAIGDARYLMLLARVGFSTGEVGARLVGIRQYAELIARVPVGGSGQTIVYRREIHQPLWHPPDGDISWHVMMIPKEFRDSRHPANADGFIYETSTSPALLFQVPTPYAPPNGGQPFGDPLAASLGNMHDLRYHWRTSQSERTLDIPVPLPCDIALFASVRQNDPTTNPSDAGLTVNQFSALTREDRFLTSFSAFAQYGVVAGALVFEDNLGEDVP